MHPADGNYHQNTFPKKVLNTNWGHRFAVKVKIVGTLTYDRGEKNMLWGLIISDFKTKIFQFYNIY